MVNTNTIYSIITADPTCSNISGASVRLLTEGCEQVSSTKTVYNNGLQIEITWDTSACTQTEGNPPWVTPLIAIAAILSLVIVLIAIIFLFPSVKEVIFPYREKPPDYQTRK